MSDKLWIFDTTLRDGNQSPGCGMTIKEKLSLSKKLADLGVDIIEAGFPISSDAEFNAVKNIAKEYSKSGPIICGFGRANKLDIDRAWEAVKYAKNKRIHIGIGTSELHLKYKFHKTKDEILEIAAKTTAHASNYDCEVEFYAEDSTRSDLKYLCEVLKTVIDNGASIINLPDTTGFSYSSDYYNMINKVKQNISNIDKVVISTHCHDDYGLATINSLEGVRAGARQVECSILGIGERSGNASLEEIIANIEKRKDIFGELENNVNL